MNSCEHVDIAIIGAGTAGLAARNIVARHTDEYVVIDPGPLGTLCARAGCMPSKALIAVANHCHEMAHPPPGLSTKASLELDSRRVMTYVRELRDSFVTGVMHEMENWKDRHLIARKAAFIDPQTLDLGDQRMHASRVLIATGSRPVIPSPFRQFREWLVNSDSLFDLEELPDRMAVIGLGPLGIELAQALHRLRVDIIATDPSKGIGGLTDPELISLAADYFGQQMTVCFEMARMKKSDPSALHLAAGKRKFLVDRALVAVGREPVIDGLGLENLGVELDEKGLPGVHPETLQIGELPVFMAGDVNGIRPVLHEAAFEGRIAAHHALGQPTDRLERPTPLTITFCTPNIALAGRSFAELQQSGCEFVAGSARFQNQGRARIMSAKVGGLRVYAEKESGKLLGAELFAPGGEHLAHLLAWAIAQHQTLSDLLRMPYYHPVLEEGLRSAIADAAHQLKP